VADVAFTTSNFGYRIVNHNGDVIIEYEQGGNAGLKVLSADTANFNLGDDTAIWRAAKGNESNNILDASAKTEAVMLDGFAGNDELHGRSDKDVLLGGNADDIISDGAGNDELWGRADSDKFSFTHTLNDQTNVDFLRDFVHVEDVF
jgi:Ca2+-binding RTX toxin-like protein